MAAATQIKPQIEKGPAIGERHRVLIAAAVAAVVGGRFRILEIKPGERASATGWKHCGRIASPIRAVLRRRIEVRLKPAPKEEKNETAHHA